MLFFDNIGELNSKKGSINSLQDRIWLIIRHTDFPNNVHFFIIKSYLLKEGDIIKFGKIIFRVKELLIKNNSIHFDKLIQTQNIHKDYNENQMEALSNNQGDILQLNNNMYHMTHANLLSKNTYENFKPKEIKIEKTNKKINKQICRICLNDENDPNNPMMNPCKCSGTMKYIHFFCLKQW